MISEAINEAFRNLSETNAMLYDYWLSELYDEEGNMIQSMWNEETVNVMETDVMSQMNKCEMQIKPSRPAVSVCSRPPSVEVEYFRGIMFRREVDHMGICKWKMSEPIQGPSFRCMRDARRWCRKNEIQHSYWQFGMPHNIF